MDYSFASVLADMLAKSDGDTAQANMFDFTKQQDETRALINAVLHPKIAANKDGKVTLSVVALQEILDAVMRADQKMRTLSKKIRALHANRMDAETSALNDDAKRTRSDFSSLMDIVHRNLPLVPPPEPTYMSSARADLFSFDESPCAEPMLPCPEMARVGGLPPLSCEAVALASVPPTTPEPTGALPPADDEDLYA